MTVLSRLVVLPLVVLLAVGACAKPEDGPGTDAPTTPAAPATVTPTVDPFRGLPEGVEASVESPAGISAGTDGEFYVFTFGSSSNPAVVHEFVVDGQDVVVDVSADKTRISTMDFVPTTSTIQLPESVDLGQPITFELGEFGSITLDSGEPGTTAWVEPKK